MPLAPGVCENTSATNERGGTRSAIASERVRVVWLLRGLLNVVVAVVVCRVGGVANR